MSGLCAILAGGLAVLTASDSFQLAWNHSVEKVEWREDWRIEGGMLRLEQASVMGSGAGMEPPPEAHRHGNRWVWSPKVEQSEILLALSDFTADWRLCADGSCRALRGLMAGETARLVACP
ncbi:DUF1850 domain-containing protein [Paramagnetospirillum kuznetsovii]|uniref:DUF1850 domain-containing protein n=1 Tax=Paramagnetospirillum kuznetsovii TaxID=2053833 RepID=A0A364NUZ4_9PROT|nr:DUF1850 domain-containing protein [Paramagnetospirillum kuznetsovii]RAU20882.1 DUF1850 domain-containing protein [Paramagnetospirillum kuznetsovii]